MAVDASGHQADQRRAAGNRARTGGAADAGADRRMGRPAGGPHGPGRARHGRLFVGMCVALGAATDFLSPRRRREISILPLTIDLPDDAAGNVRYAYNASLVGAAR